MFESQAFAAKRDLVTLFALALSALAGFGLHWALVTFP